MAGFGTAAALWGESCLKGMKSAKEGSVKEILIFLCSFFSACLEDTPSTPSPYKLGADRQDLSLLRFRVVMPKRRLANLL